MATRYHYKIVSSFDPTDIPVDSQYSIGSEAGYDTEELAEKYGEIENSSRNPYQYYVKTYSVEI